MADEEINYVKEVLKSDVNLIFVGVMAFLMLVISFWGFMPLMLAGEIGALFIAQNSRVQRIIRARKNKDKKIEVEDEEVQIIKSLPNNYQLDFQSVRVLCDEIEKRASEIGDAGTNTLMAGTLDRLSSFRHDYARMLRAHHLLSIRNYRNLDASLTREIAQAEQAVAREQSQQVKYALAQNLNILKERQARIRKLGELVRLLEARLQVIRNSLSLIQDEVYTFTDVTSISDLVDNLLMNLSLSEEFRTAYEDVLSADPGAAGMAALEATPVQPSADAVTVPIQEAEPTQQRKPRQLFNRAK
ncbi:MAG TPA: hypothetical protein VFC63_26600 [Blastocatellia bacterium]|nr:hypothetical protein [Blastocatellia bacterium]